MKISIASGKGGTGKTTISTNLASFLAIKENIVLVDLDVEEPNSGLFINADLFFKEDMFKSIPEWVVAKCTLCGICQDVCNFHAVIQLGKMIMVFPELCHSCYACSELCPDSALSMIQQRIGVLRHYKLPQLDFVESRLDIGQEQAVPLIAQTLDYIDKHFPSETLKLYDSPPGTSCPVIEATKDADFIILVTEPTPFGLHDLKLAVETMRELKKKVGVVVNRYGIGNDDVLEYCKSENILVLAKIPNDRRIAELYSNGELIYNKIPEFRQQVKFIAEYILRLKRGEVI